MKLIHKNLNSEIVIKSILNYVEFFFNCKNCIQKWILQVIFSREWCSNCPKIKIVYNFLITNQMEWTKAFYIDKNILYEK